MSFSGSWKIVYDSGFRKELKKLDKPVAARVLNALERLESFDIPQAHCKALSGPYAGLWRYRVGKYRVILDFDGTRLVILALEVTHRSEIYR